jgi:hypothetical protein
MRKTLSALVLALVFCSTVLAGDIPSPPASTASDISNPPRAVEDISSPPSAIQSSDAQTADGLMEAALNVINTMLALF